MRKQTTKNKNSEYSSVTLGVVYTQPGLKENDNQQVVKILLDSGSSSSIIHSKHVKLLETIKTEPVNWTTKAGSFATTRQCLVSLKLPALHADKVITWNYYVDEQ